MTWSRALLFFSFALAASLQAHPAVAGGVETNVAGEFRVAYRTDDKPVSFLQDGKPTGLLIELVDDDCRRLGLQVTYVSTTFAAMVPAVTEPPVGHGGVRRPRHAEARGGRRLHDARSATARRSWSAARTRRSRRSRRADGKTVAVTTGSALIPLLQKIAPKVSIKEFPNIASSTNALLAGPGRRPVHRQRHGRARGRTAPRADRDADRRERHQRAAGGEGPARAARRDEQGDRRRR